MLNMNYNPDVLSCLANLSNDEVFTPPNLVNQILDMLPEDLWSNKDAKFLDPVSKSGVFLREIAKRLIKGLENDFPDIEERVDHILTTQLYGIAITELTSLLSRRSVYCSKYADGEYSIAKSLETPEGNILYNRIEHTWKNGKCVYCGANQDAYDRDDSLETHAYEFIHTENPEELFNMKFDVIIGNPPYQLSDGGNGVSAKPLFHYFVQQAKKLNPTYLSMIIPARWYAGGKGLDGFREEMLNDRHLRELVDYESSKECFAGVNIAGGICYFLWDKNYNGDCKITNKLQDQDNVLTRKLSQFPVFVRANKAITIIEKVQSKTSDTWDKHNYARNPFGFSTNYRGAKKRSNESIEILSSQGIGFVDKAEVIKNKDLIGKYKILIGRLVPSNGELGINPKDGYRVITDTKLLLPDQIHTESYLLIGAFETEKEAKSFEKYIKTKFARFLLRQAISSVNVTKECFKFVPKQDFNSEWNDERLYKKYGLNDEEIKFIEQTMRAVD